jgi:hypothetical protein
VNYARNKFYDTGPCSGISPGTPVSTELIDRNFIFVVISNLILLEIPYLSFSLLLVSFSYAKTNSWHALGINIGSLVMLEPLASANDRILMLLTLKK